MLGSRGTREVFPGRVTRAGAAGTLSACATSPGPGAAGLVADQLLAGTWIFLFLWLVLIAYLVPDGRPLTDRWRRWMQFGLLGAVLFLVGSAGDRDGFRADHGGVDPPLALPPPGLSGLLGALGLVLVVLLFLGSALAVRARLRVSTGQVRLQLMWVLVGALAVPIGLVVLWVGYFVLGGSAWVADLTLTAVGVAMPVTIAIAILRHRLFDIRVVLSRALVYGTLLSGVLVLYALLLLGAERLGGNGTAGGLLAVAVVAVAVHPVYSWLLQRVERWVYGYRSQPQQALRLLADRAEAAGSEELDDALTQAVAEALHVDRVWVDGGAEDGEAHVVRTPLLHRDEYPATWPSRYHRAVGCPWRTLPCSATSRGTRRSSCVTGDRSTSCASPGCASWRPGRRSAAGSARTCTTASVRRWLPSCSSSTRRSPAPTTQNALLSWPSRATR